MIRIVDLVHPREIGISDLQAQGVTFLGPAIVAALDGCTIQGGSWDHGGGGIDAILWEVESARTFVIGAIGLHNCSFVNCAFVQIGFAGNAETIGKFMRGYRPK